MAEEEELHIGLFMGSPQPAMPNETRASPPPSDIDDDGSGDGDESVYSRSCIQSFSAVAEEFQSDDGAWAPRRPGPPGRRGDAGAESILSAESAGSPWAALGHELPATTTAKIPPPSTRKLSRSPSGPSPEIAFLEAQVASEEYQRN